MNQPAESSADPFGTAELRRVVLAAWQGSSARFREDANAEESLSLTGYADRLIVELAANAADAALAAGVPGRVRFSVVDGQLRAANTGAPLTAAGVAGLASLRASAKRDQPSVGHFGVGFTAVLSVTDNPVIVSSTGSVEFSSTKTRDAISATGNPALLSELMQRADHVPVLRLPWPIPKAEPPPPGFSTEVRLPLRRGCDPYQILSAAGDYLLLVLPGLTAIELPDRTIEVVGHGDGDPAVPPGAAATQIADGGVVRTWYRVGRTGFASPELLAARPVEERLRPAWSITWARPADGQLAQEVIYAPTPTDETLLLPARLIGTFPVDDTRRRLAAGPMTDFLLSEAVLAYLDLLMESPVDQRLQLVPQSGLGTGDIDTRMRLEILDRLRGLPFLVTAAGQMISPQAAVVLPGASAPLCQLAAEAVPELLITPDDRGSLPVLRSLGADTLAAHQLTAALANLSRPTDFWVRLYAELNGLDDPRVIADLADLPVPLADGRLAIGPRTCLLADWAADQAGLAFDLDRLIPRLKLVHPDLLESAAARALLSRLGAQTVDVTSILANPVVAEEISTLRDDLDDDNVDINRVYELGGLVLDLIAAGGQLPPESRQNLVLTEIDGGPWPAHQLLLPDAPLGHVVDPDADLPVVENHWFTAYSAEVLQAAGVLFGFRIVHDDQASGADHDLPDEDLWWDQHPAGLAEFWAIADLDLVDPDRWPAALEIMQQDPAARRCLEPGGYTRWWISHFAELQGRPPREWRISSAIDLAGLYDVLPAEVSDDLGILAGAQSSLAGALDDDFAGLVERFTDPDRFIAPGRVTGLTHTIAARLIDQPQFELPAGMRTLAGTVAPADSLWVLDEPWFAQVVPAASAVAGTELSGTGMDRSLVATAFDLPVASEQLDIRFRVGDVQAEAGNADVDIEARSQLVLSYFGWADPKMVIRQATELTVTWCGTDISVSWWVDAGVVWVDSTVDALARALAYATDRWAQRHLIGAVLRGEYWQLAE